MFGIVRTFAAAATAAALCVFCFFFFVHFAYTSNGCGATMVVCVRAFVYIDLINIFLLDN